MIVQTKLDPSTIDDQDYYLLTADSAFIHNKPNLKCHPTLINSNNLCNNSNLTLILTNSSDHQICIPCNITIGTSETINNLNYNINEITYDYTSDIPFQNSNTIEPIQNDIKPQHDTNTDFHPQPDHGNKINSHQNKTKNVTINIKTDDHNNIPIKPFRQSNKIETGDSKQFPSPIKRLQHNFLTF